MSPTSEPETIEALRAERDAALADAGQLRGALEAMVEQFAYWSDTAGGYHSGGLSVLEEAFDLLGWSDPCPAPDARCDEPGCRMQATCGAPTSSGYRRVCGDHYRALQEAGEGRADPR